MPQLGEAVAKHPDRLLIDAMLANPLAFDGKQYFDEDHPCYDDAATTYDNVYTEALTLEAVEAVWADMATRTGEDGDPLEVDARLLVVPPQLSLAALEITGSAQRIVTVDDGTTTTAAARENIVKGKYTALVVPRLVSEPTSWYLFDVSKVIKPFIRQVRSNPIIRSFDSGAERESFDNNEFTWGVDGDDGGSYREAIGVSLPFLGSKSTPGE